MHGAKWLAAHAHKNVCREVFPDLVRLAYHQSYSLALFCMYDRTEAKLPDVRAGFTPTTALW